MYTRAVTTTQSKLSLNPMIDDAQLESLPVNEKLRLVTTLWDQISRSGQPIVLPKSVLDDADRRVNEMKTDPDACLTEDEVWRQADGLR